MRPPKPPGNNVGACINTELLGLAQRSPTLDERVIQLFEQSRESLYRYLMVVLGDSAEAEDITQEAFLQLYRCVRDGQVIQNVRAWIFRVAHNLAISRKTGNRFVFSEPWDEICKWQTDSQPTPEEKVVLQEAFERIHMVFGQLSPQQRQCLILKAEGFRYKEIAELLGISTTNVRQLLHRAIRKMQQY